VRPSLKINVFNYPWASLNTLWIGGYKMGNSGKNAIRSAFKNATF
jgi:hypothetical protein